MIIILILSLRITPQTVWETLSVCKFKLKIVLVMADYAEANRECLLSTQVVYSRWAYFPHSGLPDLVPLHGPGREEDRTLVLFLIRFFKDSTVLGPYKRKAVSGPVSGAVALDSGRHQAYLTNPDVKSQKL